MQKTQTEDDYLTEEEIKAALSELKAADLIRLAKIAAVWAGRGMSGEDLLHEAVLRILDGRRAKWKRGMTAMAFLHSTMSSIADAGFKKKSAENAAIAPKDQNSAENIQTQIRASALSPEDELIKIENEQEYKKKNLAYSKNVFDLFEDDETATMILMGLEEGLPVQEICTVVGITQTQYDSARRRIRRTVDKNMKNPWS